MNAAEAAADGTAKNEDIPDQWDGDSDEEQATSTQQTHSTAKPEVKGTSDDDSDDGEDEPDDSHRDRVLSRYRSLLSRRVDLLGDYAGDELFLIEGDSLLLRCFSDEKLDFDHLQLLHAAYNVEHFLHNLVSRKCNFHIVFFDSHKEFCVPPTAEEKNVYKYYLARVVIIRHLQANLPRAHPGVAVRIFQHHGSDDFREYLATTGPYFVMLHDGAQPVERKGKHMRKEADQAGLDAIRVPLRHIILNFIAKGYNVALINGLEWRDTKVMTMVLEARHRTDGNQEHGLLMEPTVENRSLDAEPELSSLASFAENLTARQTLAVVAVSKLMADPPTSVDQASFMRLCCVFLLHVSLLSQLPLSARRFAAQKGDSEAQRLLRELSKVSEEILLSSAWMASKVSAEASELVDYVDGRLYLHLVQHPAKATQEFHTLVDAAEHLAHTRLSQVDITITSQASSYGSVKDLGRKDTDLAVLPFSNPIFDKHLEPVRLRIDESTAQQSGRSHRIFQELTHWHNAKKPILQKGPPTAASKKAEFWAAKREQLFMAEMRSYAASLTNAVGKSLEPETIIVGATKPGSRDVSAKGSANSSPADSDADDSAPSTKSSKKAGGGGKTAQKNAPKQARLARLAASQATKEGWAGDKVVNAWHVVCKGYEADDDVRTSFRRAKEYLSSLQTSWREVVEAECQLYMLNCVLQYWIEACIRKQQGQKVDVMALIWSLARDVLRSRGLTKTIADSIDITVDTLKLPAVPAAFRENLPARKLGFVFALPPPGKVDSLGVSIPAKDFQLLHCGPYLERSFDSRPDARVEFNPDGWQRKVLDGIDAQKSLFVVAPTSAGKTFISFYAMRKVLEADDEGVLVYVAPTKALVNQIAAEIQARYSKKFKHGGKSVWAIHTRDYRINNPTGCQVLVTVPHVLQIMLLAPSNANSWSSRVRRIIFDEVHSIGQAEDGVVWEQLLLMAPCPIIALSATVGNPGEFSSWLTDTQKAIGIDLITVQHPYRYSDLRKYYYVPPRKFAFHGVPEKTAFGTLGLQGLTGFQHVHPVAGLVDRSRGIPADLGLEPRDCLELWRAMVKYQTDKHRVPQKLDPAEALPAVSGKADVLQWEKELKAILAEWISDNSSPYAAVVKELERTFRDDKREQLQITRAANEGNFKAALRIHDRNAQNETTLPMLCRLHAQDALPAILFNYDRHQCERICQALLTQLEQAELTQRKSGPRWERTLEKWEEWKKVQEKQASKQSKLAKTKGSKGQEEDRGSKLDQQRDVADSGTSSWDAFNPGAPLEDYHFADYSLVQLSELQIYVRQLGRRNIPQYLINALQRGIGVHHAGMNRKYRQVVEILFRKGFLQVVIATGTLALGINMPCKTVVFSGDSVFLTALNYRQCAGRAGRRGFDLLGNVVFQGVSRAKICRLISSRLPDLNGHFPITTTLVLRLFTLLHESKNSKYSVGVINALLSQPRLYMGGPSFKDQTMHHLRFSIEYLRRQHLLGSNGAPLNFAGLVSHLYFTENSSFAFHALLKEGYFHDLCADIGNKNGAQSKDLMETLMLVMAHLFNRIYCRQADAEFTEKVVKPSSSIVFLPPLPKKAGEILAQHNRQTLDVFRTYVETFVKQHIKEEERKLPLTGLQVGGEDTGVANSLHTLPPTKIRSPFVALSGSGDDFDNIHDLCQTTRDGVFLEEAVIPHVSISPDETELPLNAWLLDFFKHGDVMTIEKANKVRRADIWFLLNDFSLVLATIVTSLLNFMKLKEGTDMDMLDVMGDLDVHDEAEDNQVAAEEDTSSELSGPSQADSAISLPNHPATSRTPSAAVARKKAKNTESWEDVADEEEDYQEREKRRAANAARLETEIGEVLESTGGNIEGLKDVLKAFQKLHAEFNVRFRAMWA